jgi:hypothetical protein
MLQQRARAVIRHDLAAFMATIDPAQPSFVAQQRRWFENLARVAFATWSYDYDPTDPQLSDPRSVRYRAPIWAPQQFTLSYRLRGFDALPIQLQQYPTFVRRAGHWYLASLDDFDSIGETSAVDIWDFGPVLVRRTANVLVLAHPRNRSLMDELAADMTAAIPRVDAVWTMRWSHRVVVVVPDTQHELNRITGDPSDLSQIAAVASAEVRTTAGRPDPVGDRVGINPATWPQLSALARQIVLTHELTHVATRSVTGASEPVWLTEGFADFVAYRDAGVPVPFVAADLARQVRGGRVPAGLPGDAQFAATSRQLAVAYEGAWMACRLVAQRWGLRVLDRLYAQVGTSSLPASAALSAGLARLLHLTTAQFVTDWRQFLRAQLS